MFSKLQMQVISVFCVVLSLGYFCEAGIVKTEAPLQCHICDPESCKQFDRKGKPVECMPDMLDRDNVGPSRIANFSYMPFSKLDHGIPLFSCLKIEAYDHRGNLNVLRKCQLRLAGNASCNYFYDRFNKDVERPYTNASCYLCDTDGCNAGNILYFFFPLIVISAILSFSLK